MSRKHLQKFGISLAAVALLAVAGVSAHVQAGNSEEGAQDQTELAAKAVKVDASATRKLIREIPKTMSKVTLNNQKAVFAAKDAYDSLTGAQKETVKNTKDSFTNQYVGHLNNAIKKINSLEPAAVTNVKEMITKFPKSISDITLSNQKAVFAAKDAYDSLTGAQKEMVRKASGPYTNQYVGHLNNAVKKINSLESSAVKNVKTLISRIDKSITNVTLDDTEAVYAAKDAYDNLSASEKEMVKNASDSFTNQYVGHLNNAINKIDSLAPTSVENVKTLISRINKSISKLTLEDAEVVSEAKAAYDDLTASEKEMVKNASDSFTNQYVGHLNNAINKMAELNEQSSPEETAAKKDFLAQLEKDVAAIDVANVSIENDNITVAFKSDANPANVEIAAEALVQKLIENVKVGELTIDDETFNLNDANVVNTLADYLLGVYNADDFIEKDLFVNKQYKAAITNNADVEFSLNGAVHFTVVDAE